MNSSVTKDAVTMAQEPLVRSVPVWLGTGAVMLSLLMAFVTFLVLAGFTPVAPIHDVVVSLLALDLALALVLLVIVIVEGIGLVSARRQGRVAARLHTRLVGLFGLAAGLPTIFVAVVAFVTLDRGLDLWFSARTRSIVDNSLTVANAYLQEHARTLRGEILAASNDLSRNQAALDRDPGQLKSYLNAQATLRGLPVLMLLDNQGRVVERAEVSFSRESPMPSLQDMADATLEEPVILAPGEPNMIGAVVRLKNLRASYLFVARPVDPNVLQYLRMTEAGVAEYRLLEERRVGVQVAFALMYVLISLIVLLSAIWVALGFANKLVTPIRRLMAAAMQVAQGNLYVQVPVREEEGDLSSLAQIFNGMTTELRAQRDQLLGLNAAIDERRRFTETVLSGVSAGVLSLDKTGKISLTNAAAERLLAEKDQPLIGLMIADVFAEAGELLMQAQQGRAAMGEVSITRDGQMRNLSVRIAPESSAQGGGIEDALVMTIDDITALVTAQRTAAWGDVARRIAHEIKNPLTPIQLSAERLKRKYGKSIDVDRDVFDNCIETIVRQVEDIKRMVDEFSSFARMPKPVLEKADLAALVRESLFLLRVGYPDVSIEAHLPESPVFVEMDRRLMAQVLTNTVKNATEAVAGLSGDASMQKRVQVSLAMDAGSVRLDIRDNGIGWPKEGRERLLEPYVTSRDKGTGLGLAIVAKIIEDHSGKLELLDPETGQGALLRILLPTFLSPESTAEVQP